METDIKNCILCGGKELETKEIFSFKELKDIWRYAGIEIDKYLPHINFSLKECRLCGLQFFEPQIAGSNDFYSLFKKSDYYQLRWDYKKFLKYILDYKLNSVLDYGCGDGGFLKLLPESIFKVGVDYNVENQEKNNFKLIKNNLLDFKSDIKFDGIISVQVLEHLLSPREHLRKMLSLLETGGYLFLAVPNREGILKTIENRGKCLDFLPHHLSHWSKKTMEKIAELYNLKIVNIIEEPLSYNHFKWSMEVPISIRYPGKSLKNRILRRMLFLKQKKKINSLYPEFKEKIKGHSILAIFQL